ncbi:hypothetical protein EPO33_02450 [Patescibacteria group bacterium]|nr:MAG: hypothetical protein EPO33_02450 [Patescibacteria group bacterium]
MSQDEKKVVTLAEAEAALAQHFGGPVLVALEEKQAWVFDPATGSIRRQDGKYYAVVMRDVGGYLAPVVVEEPGKTAAPGELREVGQVIIELASDGMVRTRPTKGVDGQPDVELLPSSLSKGEVLPQEGALHYSANLKRIDGHIGVHVVRVAQKEGDGWMTPQAFCRVSRDGRSLAALAKAGLL